MVYCLTLTKPSLRLHLVIFEGSLSFTQARQCVSIMIQIFVMVNERVINTNSFVDKKIKHIRKLREVGILSRKTKLLVFDTYY